MNINERIKNLKKLKDSIVDHKQAILLALSRDLGKCEAESLMTEYHQVIEELDIAINEVFHWAKKHRVSTPKTLYPAKSYYIYRPYGTVGIASPWNYPFLLSMVPLISAISAGNKVILKTSRKSINTSEIIYSILRNADIKDITYYGLGENDKNRFMNENLDMIFFTGSTNVGKKIGMMASEKMIPYVLELGGKSPCIVKESSDLEIAAKRIVWGKCINSGQTCVAPDYVLVDKSISKDFKNFLNKSLKDMFGTSPIKSENYSKIINVDEMCRLKELALEEGIYQEEDFDFENRKINPKFFFSTIDSPFMNDEIFGPFLPIIECDTWVDINNIIQIHKNPLALYLFTKSNDDINYVINNFNFGGMAINDVLTHLGNSNLPFGGINESGTGRYHGFEGFKSFSQQTSILENKFSLDNSLRYPPYGKLIKKIMS